MSHHVDTLLLNRLQIFKKPKTHLKSGALVGTSIEIELYFVAYWHNASRPYDPRVRKSVRP